MMAGVGRMVDKEEKEDSYMSENRLVLHNRDVVQYNGVS